MMNYLEKKERIAGVVEMMRARDWRGVIQHFQGGEEAREPLLIWVRPTESCLRFIAEVRTGEQILQLGVWVSCQLYTN